MNLNHLRLFRAVVEAKGVTRAARQLRISQQAVSLQIRRFERDLGIPLFTRAGRTLELTAFGREAYERAGAVLEGIRGFDHWATDRRDRGRRRLWVLCSSTPGGFVLPPLLPIFRKRHPDIEPVLRVVLTEQFAGALAEMAELDLAVHIEEFSDPQLTTWTVARDELWLVAHPDHPLAARAAITLEDVARHPIVLRQEPKQCTLARLLLDALDARGLAASVLYVGSMEGCRTAALRNLGVTYLSRFAAEEAVRAGQLRRLRVPGFAHHRTLYVAMPVGRPVSEATRDLVDLLCEQLGNALVARPRLGRPGPGRGPTRAPAVSLGGATAEGTDALRRAHPEAARRRLEARRSRRG